MICAAEDVGNADPQAIQVAVSCSLACERIGMPESQILLAQAAAYVAGAPKSNAAVNAIFAAKELVKKTGNLPVPPYLQDSHYGGAGKLGRGLGYQYAHLYKEHYSGQPYLPEGIRGEKLYEPSENGYEQQIRSRLCRLTGDTRYQEPEDLLDREQ
jgi:putative ATPase